MIYRVGKTVIWFAIAFGLAACPAERFGTKNMSVKVSVLILIQSL
jgi:hypothetical protein